MTTTPKPNIKPQANFALFANDNANIPSQFGSAKKEAKLLRGEMLDSFARIENLFSHILLKLALEPSYARETKSVQPLLAHILSAMTKCLTISGKHNSELAKLEETIENLTKKICLRNCLAHGKIDIFLNDVSEFIVVFETFKIEGDKSQILKSHYSLNELKANHQKLTSLLQKSEAHSKKILAA